MSLGMIALAIATCGRTPPLVAPPVSTPASIALEEIGAQGTPTPTATTLPPTDSPRTFVLRVSPASAQAGAEAVDMANSQQSEWVWQLDVGEPDIEAVNAGWVDAVLLKGDGDIPVGRRPIALAVPFGSQWDELTLGQAQQILIEGSDFIDPMDWADMHPELSSVLVDGYHPSDPEYPLQQTWSVHLSAGAQPAVDALLPALKQVIERDPHVELAAVGDLMLGRTIGDHLADGDLDYPFAHVAEFLQAPDLSIGNLESALGTGGHPEKKGYTFRAPPQAAVALEEAGFDILSLANNHAMDFGSQVLLEAIDELERQGISAVGAGRDETAAIQPLLVEAGSLRIAILSFVDVPIEYRGFDTLSWQAQSAAPGVTWADHSRMQREIEHVRPDTDLIIVLLHSGFEYVPQPSPPQVSAARVAIEAGADLVLGHHAHVIQPVEFHPKGVIVYGLGNFVFEDAGPPESVLLRIWLDDEGVREVKFLPMQLDESGRPFPAPGDNASDTLENLYSITRAWRVNTPGLD